MIERVNHNPVDHSGFRNYLKQVNKTYKSLERERIYEERMSNLRSWLRKLPSPWNHANLTGMRGDAPRIVNQILSDSKKPQSFYFYGASGSGKTFLTYALLRRYIGHGWASPSTVKIMSEQELLSMAYTGYIGKREFNQMLETGYMVFVVENVGTAAQYTPEKELLFWDRFVDYIHDNRILLVLSSPYKFDNFLKKLSTSSQVKLRSIMESNTVFLSSSDNKNIKDIQDQESVASIRSKAHLFE